MTRWEPDAGGRLEQAALDLFEESGYDSTTVHDIAQRAGVTKRTFFRHFADKREVLFAGSETFKQLFLDSLDAVAPNPTALDAITTTLEGVGSGLGADRDRVRRRQAIIVDNPELHERELAKLAAVAKALRASLAQRGMSESLAGLTAEITLALFRTAFERWLAGDHDDLSNSVEAAQGALSALDEAESEA